MTTHYIAPPTVDKFLQSNAFVRFIMGPLGSGKSTGCIMELMRRAGQQSPGPDGKRKTRYVIIRNSHKQLMDTAFKSFVDWFQPGVAGTWRAAESLFQIRYDDVECDVLFRPLDTPDDVKRLLSLELSGGWINEAREIPEEIMVALKGRVGRYPSKAMGGCTHPFIIMDSNPPSVDSWLWRLSEEERPANFDFFQQPPALVPGTYQVNPQAENLANLPPMYYENLIEGASDVFVDVHVRGLWGPSLSGTPVFKDTFKRDFHVAKEPLKPIQSEAYPIIVGIDFGLTPAAVIGQQDHKGRVLIFDEISTATEGLKMGLERFLDTKLIPLLNNKYAGHTIMLVGDPAGNTGSQISEETCFQTIKRFGLRGVPAPTNSIDPRISAVETLLAQHVDGQATFLISPTCKTLIKAFEYCYIYRVKRTGIEEDTPDKNEYSHLADACQYLCLRVKGVLAGKTFGFTKSGPRLIPNRVPNLAWT